MLRRLCLILCVIVAVSTSLCAVSIQQDTVTRVVDGDTIQVGEETVRLIGVDTPESVKPNSPVEPYGKEAAEYTRSQLLGKKVKLQLDVGKRDRYGRLLAYVWTSETSVIMEKSIREYMFNARLLLEGYAQVMTVPPNVKYAELFLKFEQEAREAKKGLWGLQP